MARMAAHAGQTLCKAEARTLVWTDPLPDGGRAVIKMYRRRGLLDPLRHWFVPYRAEREYRLLARLWNCGVPCAQPLSWSHATNRRHGHHEQLVTREIPDAVPLRELLRQRSPAVADLTPLFAIARQMHACGVAHGALYAANVLVSGPSTPGPQYHVIDLAHGALFSRSLVGTRPGDFDVLDLLRSIERVAPIDRCPHWLRGYGLGAEASRRLLARLPRHRLERPWRHLRRMETDGREFCDRAGRSPRYS